jgi:Fe-S-cluster containining protein
MAYSTFVSADGDALCRDCGLCCDGTFYGSVVVLPTEIERLARVGLPVLENGGACSMAQPCTALRGRLCDAYADRPSACAAYECELRKKVNAGACSLEEAKTQIASMRALLALIREGFEIPEGGSIWETILTLEEPGTPEAAALAVVRYGPAIEAVGRLLNLGRASFEPRFAGGGSR